MMQSAQRLQAFAPGDTIDFAKDHRRRDRIERGLCDRDADY
jgi:hypothetical protein